jgi:alpha-L-arabinofuranosidase
MTGMERNADVVNLASYAPLFAHVDGWQWTPDLIWVNNLETFGTPNYYVQKLYSTNKGTHTVPALVNGKPLTGQDSLYASAVIDKNTNELIIKIVNASNKQQLSNILVEGIKKLPANASVTVLQGNDPNGTNSFVAPKNIFPIESQISLKGKQIDFNAAPYSFSVMRIKCNLNDFTSPYLKVIMSKNYRWGILGAGRIADKFCTALDFVKGSEVYAVASRDVENAKAYASRYNASRYYDNYDDLIKRRKCRHNLYSHSACFSL